ncbi:MAG: hypothetical protein II072_04820 [Clostridia bacterium]|nr:hypothetical protein [Clostridia bacterium]
MKKYTRFIALLLAALFCVSLIPMSAFANTDTIRPYSEGTVTIQSEYNNAFDYLEYYSSGTWKDLNTPKHWIVETGEIVYCVEHSEGNPHGNGYTEASPSSLFGAITLEGLQSIFMYGYPCNLPDGFTEDEARQATANAIRFWLSEQGEPGSFSFTNRLAHPDWIRAKSGYEHVLTWADELLEHARNRDTITHNITFTPSELQLTKSGSSYTGQTRVTLTNINGGYTLNTSELPEGVSVSGYTGTGNDTLTITAAQSLNGSSFVLAAEGSDSRCISNMAAYVPNGDDLQNVFMCATTAQVVATASVSVNTEAFGSLRIVKKGDDGALLGGVKFGIYSDFACENLIKEVTTRSNGVATASDLPVGVVYVRELSTIEPYWIDNTVYTVEIPLNDTVEIEIENQSARGRIRIEKTGEAMTSVITTETEWGTVNAPAYSVGGLEGAMFQILDSGMNIVATLTTDEYGVAESDYLEFGDYYVVEVKAPAGYIIDSDVYPATVSYQDGDTPVVVETIEAYNERQHASMKLRKTTERWNSKTFEFEPISGEGFVFGLYTAENIGILPIDTLVEVLITSDRGVASTTNDLPAGHYYLRELSVPDAAIWMIEDSMPVDLTGDTEYIENYYYFSNPIVNDMFKGNIKVWKLDEAEPHAGLPGAVFEIYDDNGVVYCTMTTDETGCAMSCYLPIGNYHVREIHAPAGYVISDEVFDVTITTEDKETIVLEFYDHKNDFTFNKTDVSTGLPVAGARFEIYRADGTLYASVTTDENGGFGLEAIPAGHYTMIEAEAPAGYALSHQIYSFDVDEHGNITGDTSVTDEPTDLIIDKLNTYTGQPFAGIEFTLLNANGEIVRTRMTANGWRVPDDNGEESFFTNENGHVEIRYLPVGEYTLLENTPAGYVSVGTVTVTIGSDNGISNPAHITVENTPTGLIIHKIDQESGNPLSGAGFRLKVRNGLGFTDLTFDRMDNGSYFYNADGNGAYTDLMVDGMGNLTIYGLPLGYVWIEEVVTPDGYFPIPAQKVEITEDTTFERPIEFTIRNSKYIKLGMDSDWWEFPALVGGITLAVGGAVAYIVIASRKKKQESSEA